MVFQDRSEAGRQLAERLLQYRGNRDVVALGLPRGGVTVAFEIARSLQCALDVLIVRKIGFPGNPELAVGAVSETGAVVFNEDIISLYHVSKNYLEQEITRQRQEIARRVELYRQGRQAPSFAGKTVILVDDGIATGATMKAAVSAMKREKTAKLVVALPVASREAERDIAPMVDEWVCLQVPQALGAVSRFYTQFRQVEDEEVLAMLK